MHQDATLAAHGTYRRDVLNHTDLVVHEHHRHKHGVWAQSSLEPVEVEQAVVLHFEVSHLKTLALQLARGVKHRLVLGFHGDEVLAARAVEIGGTFDGQVVGLGGT